MLREGYEDFTLAEYCDGYIIQKPFSRYEGVTIIEDWFTEENRLDAIEQLFNPDPEIKDRSRSVESITGTLKRSADIPKAFSHLRLEPQ